MKTKMEYLVQRRSIRGTIALLQPGDGISIPFAEVSPTYVRHCCSILGDVLGCRFSVHKDNNEKAYIVTRIS